MQTHYLVERRRHLKKLTGRERPLNSILGLAANGDVAYFTRWASHIPDKQPERFTSIKRIDEVWKDGKDCDDIAELVGELDEDEELEECKDKLADEEDPVRKKKLRAKIRKVQKKARKARIEAARTIETAAIKRLAEHLSEHFIPYLTGKYRGGIQYLERIPKIDPDAVYTPTREMATIALEIKCLSNGKDRWDDVIQELHKEHLVSKLYIDLDKPNPALERDEYGTLNRFRGLLLDQPGRRSQGYEGYIRGLHWLHLAHQFRHLAGSDPMAFLASLDWEAVSQQERNHTILYSIGPKGCGKSSASNLLAAGFMHENTHRAPDLEHILGTFQVQIAPILLTIADDVVAGAASRYPGLKSLVTSDRTMENRKYKEAAEVAVRMSIMINADQLDKAVVAVDPQSRRFLVRKGKAPRNPGRFWPKWYDLYDPASKEPQAGTLAYHFLLAIWIPTEGKNHEVSSRYTAEMELMTMRAEKQIGRTAIVESIIEKDWGRLRRAKYSANDWQIPPEFKAQCLSKRVVRVLTRLRTVALQTTPETMPEVYSLWVENDDLAECLATHEGGFSHRLPLVGSDDPFGLNERIEAIFEIYFDPLDSPLRKDPDRFDGIDLEGLRATLYDLSTPQWDPYSFIFPSQAIRTRPLIWESLCGEGLCQTERVRNVSCVQLDEQTGGRIHKEGARIELTILPTFGEAALSFSRWHSSYFLPGLVGIEFGWSEASYELGPLFPWLLYFSMVEAKPALEDRIYWSVYSYLNDPERFAHLDVDAILAGETDPSFPLFSPYKEPNLLDPQGLFRTP